MIKKAKKRFSLFLIITLLCLTLSIFGCVCLVINHQVTKLIVNRVYTFQTTFEENDLEVLPDNYLYAEITIEGQNVFCNTLRYGKTFNNANTQQLLNEIGKKTSVVRTAKYGNYYYTVKASYSGYNIYVFDSTQIVSQYRFTVLMIAGVFALFTVLTFIISDSCSSVVFQSIEEASDKQKQFISDASHELKTPLSIISANAEVLKTSNDEKWLNNIQEQTARMGRLVEDLLSLTRTEKENKVLTKERFNVSEEAVKTILPYEAITFEKNKQIITEIQEDVYVNTNRQSFKNVLEILLDNAIKYSNEKSIITVSLKKHKNRTVLSVHNSGSEVHDQDSTKIFERFYRAENSRSREYGGSGLGLAIAKNISNANGWKIYAVSQYKVSMTITVVM